MSGFLTTDHARSRVRWAWYGAVVLIAFVSGILTARYAFTSLPWFRPQSIAAPTAKASPVAVVPEKATAPVATPVAAAIDPATLQTREALIAAQLTSIEARTATLAADVGAAGGQATRAEAVLAVAAARRALDRGMGLGYLEGQLRGRFGASQPQAVNLIIDSARRPVTLEDLHLGLDALAPDLATGTTRDGWLAGLRRELSGLIVLRKAGTPSPLPADRLARARRFIEAGQVEGARAEVAKLPGAAGAANWLAAADRYLAARRALDQLEGAALTGQAAR